MNIKIVSVVVAVAIFLLLIAAALASNSLKQFCALLELPKEAKNTQKAQNGIQ